MEMVEACLATIRLRFRTKPTFDTLTDREQDCGRIARRMEEGQMLTVSEVAGLSGGTVSEIRTGATRKLVGSGVVWVPSEPVMEIVSMPGGADVLRNMGGQSP